MLVGPTAFHSLSPPCPDSPLGPPELLADAHTLVRTNTSLLIPLLILSLTDLLAVLLYLLLAYFFSS